jgi:acyl-CoA thioester hydrolase
MFTHRLRVRYHETDGQLIVYNSRYLEYVDVALTEYMRACGWDGPGLIAVGLDPSLKRTTIEFISPAAYDEELDIAVLPQAVGNTSFTMRYEVRNAASALLLATVETVYVNIDPATKRSRAVPPAVRERLTADAGSPGQGTA